MLFISHLVYDCLLQQPKWPKTGRKPIRTGVEETGRLGIRCTGSRVSGGAPSAGLLQEAGVSTELRGCGS